jgi:hypothetical protein
VVHDESFDTICIDMTEAQAKAQLDAMLDTLFQSSRWQHTDMYSNCDPSITTHHYFDASWDLAFERAQANSQRQHEQRQLSGTSRKHTRDSTVCEGAKSHAPVLSIGVLPLRKKGHSNSPANTPPAPDPNGAVFSDVIAQDDHSISNLDPLVSPMQLSDVSAERAPQQHPLKEAPPLNARERTPIGDDSASPYTDDTIPVVSQLGSLHSLPNKQIKSPEIFQTSRPNLFLP